MNDTIKHTPGPWRWTRVKGMFDALWSDATKSPVAVAEDDEACGASFIDFDSPDARLIAAAPEMLGALNALADCTDSKTCNVLGGRVADYRRAHAMIRAAIAKARGEDL